MKLIDQTPLQDEKGEIGIIQRAQGALKYGFNWYPEMEAQKAVIALLRPKLGKGYTVIRNFTLGASGIVIPLALVGPAGIFAAYVTHLRGTYQAKGDDWDQVFGAELKPASINLLTRTKLLARALQAFIERQGLNLPNTVEPVILAANPGLHVEALQPSVRVIMVDALARWAASLGSAAPVFTVETAYELADRIVYPRPPKKKGPPGAAQAPPKSEEGPELSRAGAVLSAADEAQPFNPDDLGFAFEGSEDGELPSDLVESSPAVSLPAQSGAKKRYLGMTVPQLAVLGGLFAVLICVLIGFAILLSQNS